MKILFIKLSIFLIVPHLFLEIGYQSYEESGGDLSRVGKISIEKKYRDKFAKEYNTQKHYTELSEIRLDKSNTFDILIIGDSFSQNYEYGYHNYLASLYKYNIINIDSRNYKTDNPIQILHSFANGNILDTMKVRFIILQKVERGLVISGENIDRDKVCMINTIDEMYRKKNTTNKDIGIVQQYYQERTMYITNSLLYKINDRAFVSKTYRMKLNKKLFSTINNELLFYYSDVETIKLNTEERIHNLNNELNTLAIKLKKKGITLVLLPSPDKYDIYQDFIANNTLPKNNLFKYLEKEKKDYVYIDTKQLLNKHIVNGEEDIYFADDTHWSPATAKIVAKEVYTSLK